MNSQGSQVTGHRGCGGGGSGYGGSYIGGSSIGGDCNFGGNFGADFAGLGALKGSLEDVSGDCKVGGGGGSGSYGSYGSSVIGGDFGGFETSNGSVIGGDFGGFEMSNDSVIGGGAERGSLKEAQVAASVIIRTTTTRAFVEDEDY
ncbi:glycine-rich cell wall structural protein 1-like [Zingiber officinale]|uniref:glycine-rich cell wall structural protein 1-like n=1 Tax=Zingiber officinale TaxID=94328 RepID=UPI001C4B3CCC|nr:glycine-rich cell wall structural protein 1-like [Zingiber officinale]